MRNLSVVFPQADSFYGFVGMNVLSYHFNRFALVIKCENDSQDVLIIYNLFRML